MALNLKPCPSNSSFSFGYAGTKFSDKMFSSTYVNQRNTSSSAVNLTVRGMGGGPKYKGTQMRERKLTEMIENKVMEAKEVCDGDQSPMNARWRGTRSKRSVRQRPISGTS